MGGARLTRFYLDGFPTSEFALTAAAEPRQQYNISCVSISAGITQNRNKIHWFLEQQNLETPLKFG